MRLSRFPHKRWNFPEMETRAPRFSAYGESLASFSPYFALVLSACMHNNTHDKQTQADSFKRMRFCICPAEKRASLN